MVRANYKRSSKVRSFLKRAKSAAVAAAFVGIQTFAPLALLLNPATAHAAVNQPVANPTLTQSCGLDIAIVIDRSSSINNGELTQMKSAMTDFTNALAGTPTQFSVTSFGTSASVLQGFTANTATVNAAINGIPNTPISPNPQYTNWEDGLIKANSTLPNRTNPNLILFASDGDPTISSAGPFDNDQPNAHLAPAVTQADSIKSGGSRILALGIGFSTTTRLQAISGPNVNTGNVLTSDVITSEFDELADDLATFAKQTCGGTITTKKIIDQDGDLNTKGDQTPGQNWTFDINGTPSNPAPAVTGVSGQTVAVKVDAGTYSVNETPQAGYDLIYASCDGAASNGSVQGNSVVGVSVANENIVSCVFINKPSKGSVKVNKQVDADGNGIYEGGNTEANNLGFRWALDGSGSNTMGSTVSNASTGNHNVSENNIAGYHFTGWYPTANSAQQSCSNPQGTTLPVAVSVTANQTAEITLCNARDTGTLKVKKKVVNNNGGTATADDFTLHVKQGASDVSGSPASGSASGTSYSLPTGTYSVSEGVKSGYTQTELKCVDQANDQVVAHPVVLGANQTVVCTITNDDQAGKITVNKSVSNPYGTPLAPTAFPLFVDGNSVTHGVATQFDAGVHVISENQQAGYQFTGVSGDCTYDKGIISLLLSLDGDANCTVNNQAIQPKLKVKKVVINDNSGTRTASDFTMVVSGNSASLPNFPGSSSYVSVGLNEGSYNVDELEHEGYTQTRSGGCTGTIALGETKYCTIINNDIPHPSIQVEKSGPATAHEGDVVVYNFTVTNTGDTKLKNVGIDDDIAENELCGDTELDPGESTYCTATYTIPTQQSADVTNTVTASGTDCDDTTVTDTDTHTLDVLHASIKAVKDGPASALAGSTVTYTFTVTNTGDVPVGELTVVDSITGSANYVSGDTNLNDQLDLTETWVYKANYTIPANQTANVDNTVKACGYEAEEDEEIILYRLENIIIDQPKEERDPVCAQDSHSLSIGKVLAASTPAVLAETGQSYAKVLTAISVVSMTLLIALLGLAPRKSEN